MITQIYLDLDGVMAAFDDHVIKWLDLPITPDQVNSWEKLLEVWEDTYHRPRDEFWNRLSMSFWASIPKTKEFDYMDDMIKPYRDKVTVLTAIPSVNGAFAAAGKVMWLQKRMPWVYHSGRFLIGQGKTSVGHPGGLLIDDNQVYISKWLNRGGKGIIFPRPYNDIGRMLKPSSWRPWVQEEFRRIMNG